MTRDELAARLDGREYCDEMDDLEDNLAKCNGLVVVFGASDDLLEFRGAIHDEVGAYNGTSALITKDQLLQRHDRDCQCQFCGYEAIAKVATKIVATWGKGEFTWEITTDIPHSTFRIYEDGTPFCRGIVIDVCDVKAGT